MITLSGNAVDFFESKKANAVLIHQVNCQGVMGSGIALEIKEKYHTHFQDYLDTLKEIPKPLGSVFTTIVSENKAICGIFGQDNYGRSKKRYTNYAALFHGLTQVFSNVGNDKTTFILPKRIGCDRGGADWSIVEVFLEDMEKIFDLDIYIIDFSPTNSWESIH